MISARNRACGSGSIGPYLGFTTLPPLSWLTAALKFRLASGTAGIVSLLVIGAQPSGCVDVLPLQHITSEHHVRRGAPRR